MRKLSLILAYLLLCNIAHAQPAAVCQYEWCGALWPPAEGQDRTVGKDNCGATCIKISKEVPALPCVTNPAGQVWRVEFAKADYIYHTDIKADVVETVGTFLVLKKDGIEVARYSSKYVLG